MGEPPPLVSPGCDIAQILFNSCLQAAETAQRPTDIDPMKKKEWKERPKSLTAEHCSLAFHQLKSPPFEVDAVPELTTHVHSVELEGKRSDEVSHVKL